MALRSHLPSRNARPSASSVGHTKRTLVSSEAWKSLDRVQVLEGEHGHDGCVNALSWIDSQTLASSGDDTRVHFWRLDASTDDYEFDCTGILRTGHRNNIFNVQALPGSASHIVTCARDRQVRVFDVSRAWPAAADTHAPATLDTDSACLRVFRCHTGDVKRIIVDGATQFMTVSEDGTVRHHDMRAPHTCSSDRAREGCPPPLINMGRALPLSALTSSTLRPWYIVVAGESPYGFLFDRRAAGRRTEEEWGVPQSTDLATCVRRYGRTTRGQAEKVGGEHITGARLSNENSEELLLSYHADSIYRYYLHDDPTEDRRQHSRPPSESSSRKRRRLNTSAPDPDGDDPMEGPSPSTGSSREEDSSDEDDDMDVEEPGSDDGVPEEFQLPTVIPRTRYRGACNIATIKDVNFLGHRDEYVVSGSDDGNWFMWDKDGTLQGIWEGDGSVVNVIESHPSLPLVATSGIDDTVKIFAPAQTKEFSRMDRAEEIIASNSLQQPRRQPVVYLTPADLVRFRGALAALSGEGDDDEGGCVQQ